MEQEIWFRIISFEYFTAEDIQEHPNPTPYMNRGHQAENHESILNENFDITETSAQAVDQNLKEKTCQRHWESNCLEIKIMNLEHFQNFLSTVDVRADLVGFPGNIINELIAQMSRHTMTTRRTIISEQMQSKRNLKLPSAFCE